MTSEIEDEAKVIIMLMQKAYDSFRFNKGTLDEGIQSEANGECMSAALIVFLEHYPHLMNVWNTNGPEAVA